MQIEYNKNTFKWCSIRSKQLASSSKMVWPWFF